jgi:DNA-binding transcriptional LysR family regulator
VALRIAEVRALNTEHLHYFAHVYDMRSYNAAAKRASLTTTGLAKAMRSLEKSLGVELFEKDDLGNLEPTEYADALHHFFLNYESDFSLLRETIERIRAQKNNVIRFGSCQGMWGLMGPSFLFDLNRAHPDITLSYSEYTDRECEVGLLNQHFDLAFTVAPYSQDFVTTELFTDIVCFWVNTKFALARKEALAAWDFEGLDIAIPGKEYKVYNALLKLCAESDVTLGEIYETSELYRIFDFVAKGYGLGFTLSSVNALEMFSEYPKVCCVPSKDLTLRFGISYLPYRNLTEPEQRFYDFCVKYAGRRFGKRTE